jgi:FkbM family methyltransferase
LSPGEQRSARVFPDLRGRGEYQLPEDIRDPKVILDCGANVGYSAVYYLSKFPGARVISVEPDDRNVSLLRLNTAPYGDRATVLHSAIWPRPARMVVSKGHYRDRKEWSTQVFECEDNVSHDLNSIDIGGIMDQYKIDTIDIHKMDIERAEKAVFSENVESWINRVNFLLVELHDELCRKAFFTALDDKTFEFSESGELTLAKRLVLL